MDLDNIRLLEQVVKLGSVQRAATHLGLARSTLRRKLEGLAAEFGSELVVTTTTGVSVTPAGAVVLEQGRALVEAYARMKSSTRAPRAEATGTIRCVVPVGMPDAVRGTIMHALHAIAPSLCVEEVEHADPLEHLDEPFGLMFHFGEPPRRGDWFSRVLIRTRIVPLATDAYLAARGRPTTVAELAKHRLISWRNRLMMSPTSWPRWDGELLQVDPALVSSNGQFVHRLAQQGYGILLGNPDPMFLFEPAPLRPVLDDEIGYEITFRCLSPLPTDHDPRARSVMESIQRVLGELPVG